MMGNSFFQPLVHPSVHHGVGGVAKASGLGVLDELPSHLEDRLDERGIQEEGDFWFFQFFLI